MRTGRAGAKRPRADRPRADARPLALAVTSLAAVVALASLPAATFASTPRRGKPVTWMRAPVAVVAGTWKIINFGNVACASAANCFASASVAGAPAWQAGVWTSGGIEHWNGHAFTPASAQRARTFLQSIACAGEEDCWAVGTRHLRVGVASTTVTVHWTGASWTTVSSPSPADGAALSGVACLNQSDCLAVGGAFYSLRNSSPLLESWDGRSWHLAPIPAPPGEQTSYLSSIECSTASRCVATGFEQASPADPTQAFSEIKTGARWTIVRLPYPPQRPAATVEDLACPSADDCLAVGDSSTYSHGSYGLAYAYAARWDGSSWRQVGFSPNLNHDIAIIFGIDCTSADQCVSVGESPYQGLAAVDWDGTTFTDSTVKETGTVFQSDGCWRTRCFALGIDQRTSTTESPIASRSTT